MFESPDAARRLVATYFGGPVVDSIVAALVPSIILAPAATQKGAPALGGTRLGGLPDLPAHIPWPRPPKPVDPEAIARRGNAEAAKEMREHMARGLPYAFVGQIDLAEAAALGDVAAPLPREGRLLFFYDLAVGPWETGERPARVIHDTSTKDTLLRCPMPPDLTDAAQRLRQALVATFAEHKLPPPPENEGQAYAAPARSRRLTASLRLPQTHTVEIDAVPEIAATAKSSELDKSRMALSDAYAELCEAAEDGFDGDRWRRQQLLGSPMPEQVDPRYGAVAQSRFGKQYLSQEDWQAHGDEIFAAAREWRLLLQLDIHDWMQAQLAEGTVYFVIRAADLAAHRFDRVVGVYQQS